MPGYNDSFSYGESVGIFSSVMEERNAAYEDETYQRVEETYQPKRVTGRATCQPRRLSLHTSARHDKGSAGLDDSMNEKSVPLDDDSFSKIPVTHTCHYSGDEPPSALLNRRRRSEERCHLRVTFKDPESGERWTETEEYWERKSLNVFHEKPHAQPAGEALHKPAPSFFTTIWRYVTLNNE